MRFIIFIAIVLLIFGGVYWYTEVRTEPVPSKLTDNFTVYFFDVGQGDAILVDYKSYELLIDGGPADSDIVTKITPYIQGALEGVVITHPHADHIGGLSSVLDKFSVETLFKSADTATTEIYADVMDSISDKRVSIVGAGDNITIGPLHFNVLNGKVDGNTNENSVVLELDTAGASFLFMGDAGNTTEARIATQLQDIDILKIGHHGSGTASGKKFIQTVKPEVAIYMAGIGNSYGHPVQTILDLFHFYGATTYGTDVNGNIWVEVSDTSYTVYTDR